MGFHGGMKSADTLKSFPDITPLRVSNGAARAGGALPARLKVFNWGRNETTKGDFILDEFSAKVIPANQRALGHARVALDFEHNTLPSSATYKEGKEPRPVAAYGDVEVVHNDGLYLSNITWTPTGKESAANYEDLSIAPGTDDQRRINFIHSVALCRNGAAHDVPTFLSAKPPTIPTMLEPIPAQLTAALEQLTALTSRLEALENKSAPPVTALSAQVDGKPVEITAANIISLSAEVKKIQDALTAQATAGDAKARETIITGLTAAGQVPKGVDGQPLSLEGLRALPLSDLHLLAVNTPVTVPLNARSRRPVEGKPASTATGFARALEAHLAETATV